MSRKPKKANSAPAQVEIDFIKSNLYRVVRGDGVFGGLSPNGSIHLGFYSERVPYPQKIFHKVDGGVLQPEDVDKRHGRTANILREMEVGVSMDIGQAMVLRTWLDEKIAQYQSLVGPLPELIDRPKVNNGRSQSSAKKKVAKHLQ